MAFTQFRVADGIYILIGSSRTGDPYRKGIPTCFNFQLNVQPAILMGGLDGRRVGALGQLYLGIIVAFQEGVLAGDRVDPQKVPTRTKRP